MYVVNKIKNKVDLIIEFFIIIYQHRFSIVLSKLSFTIIWFIEYNNCLKDSKSSLCDLIYITRGISIYFVLLSLSLSFSLL